MLSLPIIDPHMHMWNLSHARYSWLTGNPPPHNPAGDMSSIANRTYEFPDYAADAAGFSIQGLVHVEAGFPDDPVLETNWLDTLANSTRNAPPIVFVAGADLTSPTLAATLDGHLGSKRLRGIRQILNYHRDPLKTYTSADLLENPAWQNGFAQLAKTPLAYDLQIYPGQAPAAAALAQKYPTTQFFINHTLMPTDRDEAGIALWRSAIITLAALPNVAIKISGLGMVDRSWTIASIRPFILHTIDHFTPARAMFASNFPVDRVHGSFAQHYQAFDTITADFSATDRTALFSATAARLYRL